MHTKKGTFLSYIVTAKEAEKVLDFEVYGLPIKTIPHPEIQIFLELSVTH